jgi:hypothetical protein
MSINTHRDKDIQEIFLHVKKLKAEYGLIDEVDKEKLDNIETIKKDKEKNFKKTNKYNISSNNVVKTVDQNETLSKFSLKTSCICDICGQNISLDENLSGLILLNRFFACEECCRDASNEILNSWIKTRNAKNEDAIPIALWLMQKNHKTQLI